MFDVVIYVGLRIFWLPAVIDMLNVIDVLNVMNVLSVIDVLNMIN
jgi:hypothetical protein